MSSGMIFVIVMVSIVTLGRIIRAAIELEAAKNGVGKRGKGRGIASGDIALLERENAALHGKIARLEERTAVLERIATDAPARLSAQIEELRG